MKTTVHIQNLKCGGCANTITKNLSALDDISDVTIGIEDASVTFDYTVEHSLELVKETLAKLGYPEDGEANSLGSKAKSMVSCAIGKITS
ncbi:heavy metal-associated domain-containing protein [Flavobacterium sp. 20NA77.7]|uniref:Heavy metal-associated domain-containing protein n=1 Tax=Flavobacterium nakdongensis TaxID=3073563 RepID=A0ABY9RDA6_9FLAO|nr:heavy metal-associated domain-containing protein [Flavobacterium sp. 20NA77.7]WMW78853.1 heavy metal-associated domain-containing protein [Flavobacterium sp. 20NA77.7]